MVLVQAPEKESGHECRIGYVLHTIFGSVLILAILAYNLVDRILDYRERMADDYEPAPDPEPEPASLDKTDQA